MESIGHGGAFIAASPITPSCWGFVEEKRTQGQGRAHQSCGLACSVGVRRIHGLTQRTSGFLWWHLLIGDLPGPMCLDIQLVPPLGRPEPLLPAPGFASEWGVQMKPNGERRGLAETQTNRDSG